MKKIARLLAFFLLVLGAQKASAQPNLFTPGAGSLFTATPLYIGASFVREVADESVKVWNKLNTAGWVGALFFVDPRTGQLDSLFNNNTAARRCTPSTLPCAASINLQAPRPGFPAGHDIRIGDTVYFMYKVFQGGNQAMDLLPKYTGPNDNPTRAIGPTILYTTPTHPNYPAYAHCFSVAGRVNLTTVEFGFEDWASAGSDYDFDDVIFGVSGLRISSEQVQTPYAVPPAPGGPGGGFTSPTLNVSLYTNTAGATIYYTLNGATPDSNSTLYNPATPIVLTGSDTIKAIAYKAGSLPSGVYTGVFVKIITGGSVLRILDQNGNTPPAGYLTEVNPQYTVQLTTQAAVPNNLTTAFARTRNQPGHPFDNENVALANPVSTGGSYVFSQKVNLALNTVAVANNGTTNSSFYDTLRVTWTNPQLATDTPSAQIPIRPAPKQAVASFSTTPNTTGNTNAFAGTENPIYIVVVDQPLPPGMTPPSMVITATPTAGSVANLPVILNPTCVGTVCTYVGIINIGPGVGQLNFSGAATLQGTYTDPLDRDQATASAGYGTPAEIAGSLVFTDNAGVVWPGGNYSPANGFLNLRYTDDLSAAPNGDVKVAALTIVNKLSNGGSGLLDTETVNVTLVLASSNATTGIWEGRIALLDLPNVTPRNGTAETYILGNVTALIGTHFNTGAPDGLASATINVAWPDLPGDISVKDVKDTSGIIISRSTDSIIIKLKDQSLSSGVDTIYVSVSCQSSGDVIGTVRMIEQVPPGGIYISEFIPKTEGLVDGTDRVLTCRANDVIRVGYLDPVYGGIVQKDVPIIDATPTDLSYANRSGVTVTEIVEGNDSNSTAFVVVVKGSTPNVLIVDTVAVTLSVRDGSGNQIDLQVVNAVETGPNTGEFRVTVPFVFLKTGNPVSNNGVIEGKIGSNTVNSVTVHGTVNLSGRAAAADLILYSALVKVASSYIVDLDGDGSPDHVVVVFQSDLPAGLLPPNLNTLWQATDAPPGISAAGGAISAFPGSTNAIIVAYPNTTWPSATGAGAGITPQVTLPNDRIYGGQVVALVDSVGPFIIDAVKKVPPKDSSSRFDTLVIHVSEPIKSGADLSTAIRVASCGNCYGQSTVLDPYSISLSPDGKTLIVILDNTKTALNTGSFVYLNRELGQVTDLPGNLPLPKGTPITGQNRDVVIRDLRGYPPVAGLDPNVNGKQFDATNPGTYKNPGDGSIGWIPPADWNGSVGAYNGAGGRDVIDPNNPQSGLPADILINSRIVSIPNNVSLVQVISAGRYIAHVRIFSNLGVHVQSFQQAFGFHQEMANDLRKAEGGWASYLVWDMKDSKGQRAGQGVYVWKVTFYFPDTHKQEVFYTRTGILRNNLAATTSP